MPASSLYFKASIDAPHDTHIMTGLLRVAPCCKLTLKVKQAQLRDTVACLTCLSCCQPFDRRSSATCCPHTECCIRPWLTGANCPGDTATSVLYQLPCMICSIWCLAWSLGCACKSAPHTRDRHAQHQRRLNCGDWNPSEQSLADASFMPESNSMYSGF